MVWIGAISAILAVALGLLLSNVEEYGGETLTTHQWSGIATMLLAVATALALRKEKLPLYRGLLALTVVGISIAGHYGTMLTHGEDYISSVLPFGKASEQPGANLANLSFISTNQPLTDKQVEDLNLEVRSILAHNCYSCHGETKMKGELRLDERDFIMQGGEDGVVVVPSKPEDSELIRRITLPTGHKEAMPSKGKRLTEKEVAILDYWIKQGAPWPSGEEKSIYRVAEMAPRLPAVPPATPQLVLPIDRFVNVYFKENNVAWKKVVDDRTYIRRVYLDVVGLLPTPDEVRTFTSDNRPGKREQLVKELLNHNEAYAQHWLSFWNDVLRNDYSGTGYITGGRKDITKWLYTSLTTNKPYNWFVRELISPTEESAGFIKGIKWRGTINSSQRTEMQAAQNVSQVFLGLNLKCASCHDSFISDWKLADAYAFANVFSDTTLEITAATNPPAKWPDELFFSKIWAKSQ